MKLTKKQLLGLGITDFDAWARYARRPYGEALDKRWDATDKKSQFQCEGGPLDGELIALTAHGDGNYRDCVSSLVFRVGEQVGRYVGFTFAKVRWEDMS